MATSVLTTAEEKILDQFTTYPYLTGEQVTRLLYSSGSARYVSAKLKTLTEEKLLHRLERETINFPVCLLSWYSWYPVLAISRI